MAKKQHYMTERERYKLESYLEAGRSVAWIARQMNFCRQTIYNELKRGAYQRIVKRNGMYRDEIQYSADKAQQIHRENQTTKGRPLAIGKDRAYADFLERKILEERYSPAAALAEARKQGFTSSVCVSTLYSYIDKQIFRQLTNRDLWVKSRRKKRSYRPIQRVAHSKLPSIADRPDHIGRRDEYGHWEMDLVVGTAKSRYVLLTLTERRSRQEMIFKLPNRKAATIRAVFDRLERRIPDFRQRFRSITTDNGPEFLEYEQLRRSIRGGVRFEIYYCHSYAAWEKGTNENHNRMIRRWFPKGTDFRRVSQSQIKQVEQWMNQYPRKILDWSSPNDAAA